MVESTALEMRHTRKGIEGSNPSLSAIVALKLKDTSKILWVRPNSRPNSAVGLERTIADTCLEVFRV